MDRKESQRIVDWKKTGIHGKSTRHQAFSVLTHATDIERAISIFKRRSIEPRPEREHGKILLDKPIEVVWLSPNSWSNNVYGCIALDYDWTELQKEYGRFTYGLEEIEGGSRRSGPMWTSRILFSHTDFRRYFGPCYDRTADGGMPWRTHEGIHYIRNGCVLQVGVTMPISVDDLQGIRFINEGDCGRKGLEVCFAEAARFFLARAVSEQNGTDIVLTD